MSSIPFEILSTDKHFHDSPDTGDPACICSRCGKFIPESDIAIRAWPTEPGDQGFDPAAKGGTEFRYHPSCLGMAVHEPYDFMDLDFLP